MPDRPGRTGPKYRQIADELRAAIISGEYQAGDQLPTKAVLQEQFGVAVNTVERAIEVLRHEGLVKSTQGAGMYVLQKDADPPVDFATVMKRLDEISDQVMQLRNRVDWLEQQ